MAKTIEQYKADYAAAKAAGNAAAMQAANNGANAIRAAQGQAGEYATADIAKTAAKNTTPTPTPAPTNTTKTNTSSVAGVGASNATQQSILDAMAANSAAWHTASAADKARLEAQNKSYANQLGALGLNLGFNSGSGMWSGAATTQAPTAGNVTKPGLNGLPLGDVYGLTYDHDKILGLLNKATTDAYAARETEAKQTENTFYRNMVDTQSATLDTLRQTQAAAVATGASKGIAAAQELSAILGMQEEAGVGATDLANARLNLSEKKQAEMSGNASSALDTSNAIKQAIANMDLTKYGYDVQKLMGDLDYLASLHNSDKTLEGVKYNADKNLQGTQYATDNQPKYNSSGGNSWSGGYTNNAPTSDKPTTTPTAPSGDGVKSATGGNLSAKSLDDSIAAGGGNATLTGTNFLVRKESDGTYSLLQPDANGEYTSGEGSLTWQQVARIQNNNDKKAAYANYGANDFVSALEQNGRKLNVGGTAYTYDAGTKAWYSGTGSAQGKPEVIDAVAVSQVQQQEGLKDRNAVAKWYERMGQRATLNADGSITLQPLSSAPSKTTSDLFSVAKNKTIANGTKFYLGSGDPYTYDANAGIWTNLKGARINMPTMINKLKSWTSSVMF